METGYSSELPNEGQRTKLPDHDAVSHKYQIQHGLPWLLLIPCCAAKMCLRLLGNRAEIVRTWRTPEHIWRWNAITDKFEKLEALMFNNSALCSVDEAKDARGKTLIVTIDPMNPYIMENADRNGLTGFIGDVWTALEGALKFKTIYRRARWNYGVTLMNGDTHALLVATAMYSYTSGHYTYSTSFASSSYALFVQPDGEWVSRWYINTFSSGLWLTSFLFVVCIACSIMGIYRVKKLTYTNYRECNDEFSSPTFNILYVLGGISGQGFQEIPRCWSFRLIILSYLMMGILLSCGFSSTLTSELANRGNSVPLANLEDIPIKRTHSLCVRSDSSAYLHFTVDRSTRGNIKANWKGLVNNGCPDMRNSAALVSELCRPGFAYLEAPAIFLPVYYKVRHNCSIVQLPDTCCNRKLTFLHTRASQYRDLIDIYLLRMGSVGILNYLEKKWLPTKIYDQPNSLQRNAFQPVKYEHIQLAFYGLFAMMVISGLICILENIWYKLQSKLNKVNPNSILLETYKNNWSGKRACYKTCSLPVVIRRCRKVNSIFLPGNIRNSEFLQSVTLRTINRKMSHI